MTFDDKYRELKKSLIACGAYERTPVRIIGELLLLVAITAAGLLLVIQSDSLIWQALGTFAVAWAGLAVSTNAHTASHGAVSNKRWVNRALTYFGYPFFLQISANFWHYKHLVTHHGHTNILGLDDDADVYPYFAINEKSFAESRGLRRWYYRHQAGFLPLLMFCNSFIVCYRGWRFVVEKLCHAKTRRTRHWVDLSLLLANVALWWIWPMAVFGWVDVLLFNVARFGIASYGMFAIFAPAHFPAEADLLAQENQISDRLLAQTAATVNFTTGPIGRLLCSGVQYQIEHHLFPTLSHTHYPRVSGLVQAFCEQHGYPYRSLGWGEGIWKSVVTFARPKPVRRDSSCRPVAMAPVASSTEEIPAPAEMRQAA